MDSDVVDISVAEGNKGSRKKPKKISQREMKRRERYSRPRFDEALTATCRHTEKSKFKCSKIEVAEIENCRRRIYHSNNKVIQDQQICHHIIIDTPRRRRPKLNNPRKKHSIAVEYIIPNPFGRGYKRVCKGFFKKITKLSNSRLVRVAKVLQKGGIPTENRGGDQKSHKLSANKNEVRQFLNQLRGQESHYGANKSKRLYLGCNLNISRLYKLYKNFGDPNMSKVSFSTFHKIFSREFNIGFKSPATDICSMCERLKNRIKREEDVITKQQLIAEKRVHILKANAFYALLKEKPENTKVYCFDLQQVQPLPKTAINDAFYLRQISYYTSVIVGPDSKNPYFYTWTENQAKRGSTEISSALFSFLNTYVEDKKEENTDIKYIRLFCDACGGQNRNRHLIHMLMYWLENTKTNIESITLYFPVRGHSFLPADRCFGRVESILRKEPSIKTKEEYYELYKQVGPLHVLGTDWKLYNVKDLEQVMKKVIGINSYKRIVIAKRLSKNKTTVMYKGHSHYRYESDIEVFQNLVKRGRSLRSFELNEFPLGQQLPPQKLQDVEKLLKAAFNNDWQLDPELQFYKNLLDENPYEGNSQIDNEDEETQLDEMCDCLREEDPAMHI